MINPVRLHVVARLPRVRTDVDASLEFGRSARNLNRAALLCASILAVQRWAQSRSAGMAALSGAPPAAGSGEADGLLSRAR